ncbi:MAG TPA: hypothetical protein EYG97_03450 [Arcobacter sp.]|nr:hypothetical protein [Arcobacter sp.]HIP56057.1 hypothetical protein [Arcobacter sp.]
MNKLLLKTLLVVSVSSLVFTSCSSKKEVKKEEVVSFACKQDGVLAPKWTCNPYAKDSVAAVGIAKMNAGNDKSFQRSEAMADGRDALASQISTKVSNLFKSYKSTTGSGAQATFDAANSKVSKQLASQTLNNTISLDTWSHPKTKELYLLITVSNKSVSSAMEDSIKTSFKNDLAMYQEYKASKANGELDKELEKAGM